MVGERSELDDLHRLKTEEQEDCLLDPAVHAPAAVGSLLGEAERASVEPGDRLFDGAAGVFGGGLAAESGLDGVLEFRGHAGIVSGLVPQALRDLGCDGCRRAVGVDWLGVFKAPQPGVLALGVLPGARR